MFINEYRIYIDGKVKYHYNQCFDLITVYDGPPDVNGKPKGANCRTARSNENKLKYIAEMGNLTLRDGNDDDSQRLLRAFMLRMVQDLHSRKDLSKYETAKLALKALEEDQDYDMSAVKVALKEVFERNAKVGPLSGFSLIYVAGVST